MSKIKLIVGLGNIGAQYEGTRHNAGEWFVESIARKLNTTLSFDSKFHGAIAQSYIANDKLWLLYPHTYMNKSGLAVSKLAQFYKIDAEEILVAHDELDLPCGQLRLKKGGGHGGHNGLKDIDAALGTRDYYRLRIGINHPGDKSKVIGYVLSKPCLEDKIAIDDSIKRAISHLEDIIHGNYQAVMNQLHQK
ncbi:aminoacyl-tRNA hydrolase [Fastidiosibacter lacustris]|uniref:aminoacyl-tRNA hydrolase n=1 Tax=Fastidiosibacter lacustris TaxID=2056695 RepID=UPI000E3555EB|nr:aminoacyl-tRNA hydrolase [Fastidiosibacter lacustris]